MWMLWGKNSVDNGEDGYCGVCVLCAYAAVNEKKGMNEIRRYWEELGH